MSCAQRVCWDGIIANGWRARVTPDRSFDFGSSISECVTILFVVTQPRSTAPVFVVGNTVDKLTSNFEIFIEKTSVA